MQEPLSQRGPGPIQGIVTPHTALSSLQWCPSLVLPQAITTFFSSLILWEKCSHPDFSDNSLLDKVNFHTHHPCYSFPDPSHSSCFTFLWVFLETVLFPTASFCQVPWYSYKVNVHIDKSTAFLWVTPVIRKEIIQICHIIFLRCTHDLWEYFTYLYPLLLPKRFRAGESMLPVFVKKSANP